MAFQAPNPYGSQFQGNTGYQQPQGPSGLDETVGGIKTGKAVGSTLMGVNKLMGGAAGSAPSWLSGTASTMGKYMPYVAGGLGIYDMAKHWKDNSLLGDISSGSGIGTMILPGIGTAIGAGLGALKHGIQQWTKPSETELQGRGLNDQFTSQLASMATPQEKQQVLQNHAGWANPNDALDIVVMRNRLIQQGTDPQQADQQAQQWKKGMWNAERSGRESVYAAANPIMKMMTGKDPQLYQQWNAGNK